MDKQNLQYHIQCGDGDVGGYCILPGDPGRCALIASFLEDVQPVAQNREFTTYTGKLSGVKVSVVSTGIGGPSAAIAMEELAHIGAHTFIRVGTCGGMAMDVTPADLVIATGAIRAEGTSREYVPVEFPAVADHRVTAALIRAAEEMGHAHHAGVVHCKDSFYGQHAPGSMPAEDRLLSDWKAWLRAGALASEMESASLFVVASVRRLRCGAVFTAVWNQQRREAGIVEEAFHDSTDAVKTAILAMKYLISEDFSEP